MNANAKPFFVAVTFILLIALFAGGAMSSTDLTPDTPPAPNSPSVFDAFDTDTTIPNSGGTFSNGTFSNGTLSGSPCGSTYTVRSGDTLSRIAQTCGVTLADMLAANPFIIDPNYISPGQTLNIYYVQLPAEPLAQPESAPTAQPTAVLPAVQDAPAAGMVPGGAVNVTVRGLPGKTPATISIGKVGEKPIKLEERDTDENGQISLNVAIPKSAQPGESWQVTITTLNLPPLVATSEPFVIQ